VYDHVENKLELTYDYQGEQTVKNIAKPVRVYRVGSESPSPLVGESDGKGSTSEAERAKYQEPKAKRRSAWALGIGTGLLLLAVALLTVRYRAVSPPSPQSFAPSPQVQPASLPLPDKPSLVVLPFVNMSKDPDQEYVSDGLTDVLTGDLSKISSLFVIARNSAFTYKGKAVNMQDIRKELGVRYVLEGSVQKAGQQVRIVAQLIDTTTDSHLWSQRYDRPFTDIFALQDEIVQKIVTTLKLQLTLEEQGWLVRKTTDNLDAYDALLRGVAYFWRTTKESNIQARQMYEKAIALDSQYTEAYVNLGWTYYMEWVWHWSADPQTLERALALAQQALTLNDFVPGAHLLLGQVYIHQQRYDQAVAEGERAIALDPNNADIYALYADVLNFAGRSEDALRVIEQAMRLNPHYSPLYLWQLGFASTYAGQYAKAIATLKETISRMPNFNPAYLALTESYLWQWLAQQSPAAQTLEPAMTAAQQALALNDSWNANHTGSLSTSSSTIRLWRTWSGAWRSLLTRRTAMRGWQKY
jgi:TolB-like protein/Flp pilus assembly protein TadD